MSILNEGAGIAVEIDGLLRIEKHLLARIHLEYEILQGPQTNHVVKTLLFRFVYIGQLTAFIRSGFCLEVHILNQLVGIHYRAFTGLHLALRQFYHAVRQMEYALCPVETELAENEFQHLEMIVLLVADHINVRIQIEFGETALCGTQILRNINRSTVGTKQQLAVEPVGGKVAPDAAVRVLHEHSAVEPLLHEFLAQKVGLMLIVCLVEADAKGAVSLLEAVEYPAVHLCPEGTHFRVSLLPFHQHFMYIVDYLGMLLLHFGIGNVAVAHQMIPFDAGALRSGSVELLLPRIHALADVYPAVVHQRHLDHLVSRGREQAAHRISEKIVAYVPEVKGLVGIGG